MPKQEYDSPSTSIGDYRHQDSAADASSQHLPAASLGEYVQHYATAAANAVFKAGFDGVEVHAADAGLLSGFLQPSANERTDAYGGSIKNRARFPLDVVNAVVQAVGARRTGIRISPWATPRGTHPPGCPSPRHAAADYAFAAP